MTKIIKVENLSFGYGAQELLHNISFKISSGEIIGLVGENGAGKTTLLNILLGHLRGSGNISIFDQKPGSQRSKVLTGVMRQADIAIQNVTVSEILKEIGACYPSSTNPSQLLQELNLLNIADKYLLTLSGGQLRRVSFAIASIANPRLLFLDEPTVGMDVNARESFWKRIIRLKEQGRTIVVTSHYLDEIQEVADRILILNAGEIVFQGTITELQQQHQLVHITFQSVNTIENLRGVPGICESRCEKGIVHITSNDGDATLYALMSLPEKLRHITVIRESLENIFIELTRNEAD